MSVETRRFGRSDDFISEIGLGCGGYWGLPAFPEDRAAAIVELALERGVTFFDTGPNYSRGNAEARLGRILEGRGDGVFLATKVGSRLEGGRTVKDWSPGGIRASAEASLRKLRTDRVQLIQFHSPSLEVLENDAAIGALVSLKEDGLASHVGLSADGEVAQRAIELGVFDSLMLTHNVLHQSDSGQIIEKAAGAGVAVLIKSPMAHAVFGSSFYRVTSRARLWYLLRVLKNYRRDLSLSRRLRFLNHLDGWTPARAALRFVLENAHVTSAVIGTTNPEHLLESLSVSGGPPLPGEVMERIKEARL